MQLASRCIYLPASVKGAQSAVSLSTRLQCNQRRRLSLCPSPSTTNASTHRMDAIPVGITVPDTGLTCILRLPLTPNRQESWQINPGNRQDRNPLQAARTLHPSPHSLSIHLPIQEAWLSARTSYIQPTHTTTSRITVYQRQHWPKPWNDAKHSRCSSSSDVYRPCGWTLECTLGRRRSS
jgi:hypothetical protein